MNSEHVSHLQRMANESWRGSPEHSALTAAIASLSAQQPPAEAQPVGYLSKGIQDGEEAIGFRAGPGYRSFALANGDTPLYTAPPSAPVGVDGLPERWRREAPQAGVDSGEDAARAYREAVYWCSFQLEEALSQQPASDGGFTAADMMDARQEGRKEAQQPAAVDEALRAEVERLQAEVDNRWAQGVHTCHDKCQRIACVLRRDNERLAEALRQIRKTGYTDIGDRMMVDAALRDHDQEGKDG